MLGAHGYYSFKISNPVAFYENLVMDPARKYRKDDIIGQLKAEMMPKIQAAITKVAPLCVNGYQDIYVHDKDIALFLNEELKEDWVEGRGIELVKVALTPELSPQDTQRVMDLENARTLSNANMAMGSMVNAQNEAMKTAAGNAGGAVNGLMGVNMAGNMAGVKPSDLQPAANTQASQADSWICPNCHKSVQGKFCSECGTPKPVNQAKFCTQCGAKLDASSKFCPNCGTKVQ
jgi:membrane protease subunit (stomatin/prohibitin family)